MTRCTRGCPRLCRRHAAAGRCLGGRAPRIGHPPTFRIYEKEKPGDPELHCDFIFISEGLRPRLRSIRSRYANAGLRSSARDPDAGVGACGIGAAQGRTATIQGSPRSLPRRPSRRHAHLDLAHVRIRNPHVHRRALHAGSARPDLVRALAPLRRRGGAGRGQARARRGVRRRLRQLSARPRRRCGDGCGHCGGRHRPRSRALRAAEPAVHRRLRHRVATARRERRSCRVVRNHRALARAGADARRVSPRACRGRHPGHFVTQPPRLQRGRRRRESLPRARTRSRGTGGAAGARISAPGLVCAARRRPVGVVGGRSAAAAQARS